MRHDLGSALARLPYPGGSVATWSDYHTNAEVFDCWLGEWQRKVLIDAFVLTCGAVDPRFIILDKIDRVFRELTMFSRRAEGLEGWTARPRVPLCRKVDLDGL